MTMMKIFASFRPWDGRTWNKTKFNRTFRNRNPILFQPSYNVPATDTIGSIDTKWLTMTVTLQQRFSWCGMKSTLGLVLSYWSYSN